MLVIVSVAFSSGANMYTYNIMYVTKLYLEEISKIYDTGVHTLTYTLVLKHTLTLTNTHTHMYTLSHTYTEDNGECVSD